ncbi:MAG: NERD domain-containing protein [Pseudomonadales bacterium]
MLDAITATPAIWVMLLIVALLGFLQSAYVKGFIGELRVRLATDFLLDGKEYHPLHNVTLRTPDGTTQIDHIVVSPFGLFVIETKNLSGWIFGDARSKRWTQSLFRKKFQFQNPLHQNFKHVKAVEAHTGLSLREIHSVVVFVGKSRFKSFMPENVVNLRGFLPYVRSRRDRLLDDGQIADVIRSLNRGKLSFFGVGRHHVRGLKANAEQPVCPRCGREMVLRTSRYGSSAGSQFWGCSGYPGCKATRRATI